MVVGIWVGEVMAEMMRRMLRMSKERVVWRVGGWKISWVAKMRLEFGGRVDGGGNMIGERSTPSRIGG